MPKIATRRRLESREDEILAPFALKSARTARRLGEPDDGRRLDYRTAFQRDRDRIVYSRAFRRLRQKAQTGFLPTYEDHRRNRLTHTLEVAQLARTVARALSLNEDLVEAVALGHDLGQPPFGPVGTRALDDLFSGRLDGRGGFGLGDLGGFRTARQSLRVVDRLEKRYAHAGLNLTDEVREGIVKCGGPIPVPEAEARCLRLGNAPAFEVQVVAWADRIATAVHDLDDALQSGATEWSRVERLACVRWLRDKLGSRWPARAGRFVKGNALHRGLTHLLVTSLIVESERSLEAWSARHGVESPERFYAVRDDAVGGSEVAPGSAGRSALVDLEGYLEAKVRRGYEPDRVEARGRRVCLGLIAAYHTDPSLLDDHVLIRYREVAGGRFLRDLARDDARREIDGRLRSDSAFARVLCDHVAAMTDAYATAEHARLLEMAAVPVPSVEQIRREERS